MKPNEEVLRNLKDAQAKTEIARKAKTETEIAEDALDEATMVMEDAQHALWASFEEGAEPPEQAQAAELVPGLEDFLSKARLKPRKDEFLEWCTVHYVSSREKLFKLLVSDNCRQITDALKLKPLENRRIRATLAWQRLRNTLLFVSDGCSWIPSCSR